MFARLFGQAGKKKPHPAELRWQMNELRWRIIRTGRARRAVPIPLSESVAELPWRLFGDKRRLIATGIAGFSALGVAAATAVVEPSVPVGAQPVLERLIVTPEAIPAEETPYIYEGHVSAGDTMQSLFERLSISDAQSLAFLQKNPDAVRAIQQLRSGHSFTATVDTSGRLLSMRLPITAGGDSFEISRKAAHQAFTVLSAPIALENGTEMRSGVIQNSIFAATESAGIPDSITRQLTDLFGSEIDFHVDLRQGDTFAVIYKTAYDRGSPAQVGQVVAAEFVNQGVRYAVFLHTSSNGQSEYYKSTGQSLRTAFLRSPLEFSRVTSTFGGRVHPVLGGWRNHTGVDFGAPTGTPVRATADGVITYIGRYGGYGKYITLKHRDNVTTSYAHLNAYAPGLSLGETIRQGEIIGEVGATGRVTAAHLHYEFRVNGVAQDPMTTVLPNPEPLKGKELARFRENTRIQLARLGLLNHRIASNKNEGETGKASRRL
ncbi:MAG: M23 family metallopeptidase [Azoarcus sp.]|jgi:murein DD-endopeptidase MepM/ murein hydrolase activator NlpD|nr:M23 family metallopeptidase [Azoarcus sp.]